ncbi:MAG: pilus assembly protein TadG-related protein, partial [Pseudomonadota bacterium]|nr:pilus assembly protein TadG-related protein [Pseudomonadota bacterium]
MSLEQVRRFLRNEAGNYAMLFAISAFPILGTVSLAVEYSGMQRHRASVQHALDAATLAAAKEFSAGVTGDALTAYAKEFFEANLSGHVDPSRVQVHLKLIDEPITDSNGDATTIRTVRMDATIDYRSSIAGSIGFDDFTIGVISQVALGNLTVEVALVMDNSGSMASNGKLTLEKSTARQLVDTIFAAGASSNKPDPVSFSLVPFAAMVNIGAGNANEGWMDTNGWSPIHWENLNWTTYITANPTQQNNAGFREKVNNVWHWRSRFDVYDMMDIDWTGCVEMRPWPYNTNDETVTSGASVDGMTQVSSSSKASDRDAFYVPIFAPDEPDSSYPYKSGKKTKTSGDWYSYPNDYAYDWARPDPSNPSQIEQLYYDDGFQSY